MTQPTPQAIAAARHAQERWQIPASISLAQWALESGWGKHVSAPHNYFGMKAKPGQPCHVVPTREVYKGHSVIVQAAFRSFGSDQEAFDEHARLLATAPCYGPARAHLPDAIAFAHALTGVYATDPKYGDLLERIIRGSRLTRYDD